MTKTLEIELEEECLECPELSLTTEKLWSDNQCINIHACCHSDFCKRVRKAWDAVRARKSEIVCCKDCEYAQPDGSFSDGSAAYLCEYDIFKRHGADYYCAAGERRRDDDL